MPRNAIVLLIITFALLPSSYYLALAALILAYKIVRRKGRLPLVLFKLVVPLFLIILSGVIFANFDNGYEALKDLWYIGKVILIAQVGIVIGYYMPPNSRWFRSAVLWCSLVSIAQLLGHATGISATGVINPSFAAVFLVPFALKYLQDGKALSAAYCWILISPILLVVVLSGSRTTLVLLFIAAIGARGLFQSSSKIVLSGLAVILLVSVALPFLPQYDISSITFWGKVQNSLNEILFEHGEDYSSITANWRGYEAYKAFQMWLSASVGEKIFGGGLGTLIDLGFYMELGPDYIVRYVSLLHNAYFTLLVKYGLVGVVLFVVFIVKPFRLKAIPNDPSSIFASRVGITAAITLLVTTISVSGPLNKSALDGIMLLWGWSIGMQLQRYLVLQTSRQAQQSTSAHSSSRTIPSTKVT